MSVLLADPPTRSKQLPVPSRLGKSLVGDVTVMALLLLIAVLSTTGWFSADEVVLRQQSTALAEEGTWAVPANLTADAVDPERQFVLLARADRAGAEIVPYGKHPILPVLLSVFQRIGGEPGRYLPAALAAVTSALIVSALSGWSRLGLWVMALGGPVLFHVTVLWGHAPALAFSAIAMMGVHRICERKNADPVGLALLVAGLAGTSLFRSEGLLLAASVAFAFLTLAVVSKTDRYLATLAPVPFVTAVAVYMGEPVVREWLIGGSASPLGPPTGDGLTLGSRLVVAQIMLVQPSLNGNPVGNLRLVGLLVLAGASFAAWRRTGLSPAVVVLSCTGGAAYLLAFAEGPSPALLVTMPWIAIALPWMRLDSAFDRVTALLIPGFVAAVILTSYENAGGGDWGARYLFIVLPYLAVISVPAIVRAWNDPGGRPVVLAAVVAAVAVQGGVVLDLVGRGETVATVDAVVDAIERQESNSSESVAAVSDERLARFLYDRGLRGPSFYVPPEREEEFEILLDEAGVTEIIWVDVGGGRGGDSIETHGSVSIRTAVRR